MRTRSFVPWLLVATTALGGVGIGPVLAQAIVEPGWPPPEGAACKPSKSDDEEAQTLFKLGQKAEDTSNYTDAIKYYKDSYKRACNKHLLLKNLGRVYEKDSQYAAAVEAYKMYRARGKPTGEELDLIDAKIANLSKKVPTEPTATTTAEPTGTATATGAPTATTEPTTTATVNPVATSTVPTVESKGVGPAPFILMGVGGAALIAGGVLWGVGDSTLGKKSDEFSQNNCNVNTPKTPAQRSLCQSIADDGNSAQDLRTIGIVTTVVGGAAAIGGVVWYLVGSSKPKKAEPHVTLTPGPTFAGLGLAGEF